MAKIVLMTHFDSVSGKYSRTDKVYTRVRKFDNMTIGVALKNPVTSDSLTESQLIVEEKFKKVQAKVSTELADVTKRATYLLQWKKQKKYKTLRGFVFAQLYSEETA